MSRREAATLTLEGIRKTYGGVVAVDNVSLAIAPGRFLTILGPSGSGKTTVLMMIAGFVTPSAGRIRLADRDITALTPEKRDFGMVFQGYALFPHMTVAENIAFPLKLRNHPAAEIARDVDRMLDMIELRGLGSRLPRQLSGGQQQRVALGRALVFDPTLLLLDEPLSALDKKLRAGLQEELRALHRRLGTTFVFVTHDQDEALSMSDEIAIMNGGRVVQTSAPSELYDRPVSHFVADFLGRSNFFDGTVEGHESGVLVFSTQGRTFRQSWSEPLATDHVLIGLRPEKIAVSATRPDGQRNAVQGRIAGTAYHGSGHQLSVDTPIGLMQAVVSSWKGPVRPEPGAEVWLSWDDDAAVVLRDDR